MSTATSLPLWKKILFTIITFTVFFAGIELILTLAGVKPVLIVEDPFVGFAGDIPLFVEQVQPDGTVMYSTANNKIGTFNMQQFPKAKSENSYRIFCMGGSTTYGHPFFDDTSFCGWLREFLYAADPSKNWEVINAGGISYASYRVTRLMIELSQYQPDMFIVYSGQNEFLEERTFRNIKEIPEWLLNVKATLAKTRTYTVMNNVLDGLADKGSEKSESQNILSEEVDEILDHTVGPTSYTRDDALKEEVINHYIFNLRRMIDIAEAFDSKIIFVTPASKVKDIQPFKSENRTGMTDAEKERWTLLYNEGKSLLKSGKSSEALEKFNEAVILDDRHADLHYRMGQALFDLKHYKEAEISFKKAIDEDICPLRILSPMSRAVHEVAKDNDVPLIDFVKLIEEDCESRYGHTIPGDEFFLDHVHATIEGYRMLGLALLNELVGQGIAKAGPQWNESTIAAVTEKVEHRHYSSDKRVRSLINLANTINWAGMSEEGERLLLQQLQKEKDEKSKALIYQVLAEFKLQKGEEETAIEYWYTALEALPDDYSIRHDLALVLQNEIRLEEALTQNYEILRIVEERLQKPHNAEVEEHDPVTVADMVSARINIGDMLSFQGKTEEAITQYSKALQLDPDEASAHTGMGIALAENGQATEAIDHLSTALKIDPDSGDAHMYLGDIMNRQGRLEEAIYHYSEGLKIEPDYAKGHNNLGVVYAKQGNIDKAAECFSSAVKMDPGLADAHYNLGRALATLGKAEEAMFHFNEAQKIQAGL